MILASMGMGTIAENILASHCGKSSFSPSEFILTSVDLALANDITAPNDLLSFVGASVQKEGGYFDIPHFDDFLK
ncbi:MAG TPA: hypothetical protein VKM55_18450 [Candidatus Lokiarchaeia archaeon]|nr:hypothetical protein [Candidatus Lokiarchaeia archaeon]